MNQKTKKMTTVNIILLITTILTALITGLLYGYSCSVNLGLGLLPDREYLAAMQSINKEILNPLFFASFLGTLVLLPLSTYLHKGQPVSSQFTLLLIATLIYAIGVIGITFFGNVPLNDTLARVNLHSASVEEIARSVKYTVNWQIKENVFINGAEKETDMDKLLGIIKSSGYKGYLPIETLGKGDPKIKVITLLAKLQKAI